MTTVAEEKNGASAVTRARENPPSRKSAEHYCGALDDPSGYDGQLAVGVGQHRIAGPDLLLLRGHRSEAELAQRFGLRNRFDRSRAFVFDGRHRRHFQNLRWLGGSGVSW